MLSQPGVCCIIILPVHNVNTLDAVNTAIFRQQELPIISVSRIVFRGVTVRKWVGKGLKKGGLGPVGRVGNGPQPAPGSMGIVAKARQGIPSAPAARGPFLAFSGPRTHRKATRPYDLIDLAR